MSGVRIPAVAGLFYPADRATLETEIDAYLAAASTTSCQPRAIIVPHAGYQYSGAIAASAYSLFERVKAQIKHVVLLGPSHRIAFNGLALPSSHHFLTPLGTMNINQEKAEKILALPFVTRNESAHCSEHSLEVQLPFLQRVLNSFTLLPIVVGNANKEQVCEVLELIGNAENTLIVISTDLSHYHEYTLAQSLDQKTSSAILKLEPEHIGHEDACGRTPLNGLLSFARKHNLTPKLLDLRNSGDTAGDHKRVVGYGSYVFT